MTGLSIDVIKNQIRLSKMFAGSEAVSTKALKELLEYKETGLTPQDIKEMEKNNIMIRLEKKEEHQKVENLVRESFWNVYRPGCLEHYV